jgi:hypothetical protein
LGDELKIYRGSWPNEAQVAINKWSTPLLSSYQINNPHRKFAPEDVNLQTPQNRSEADPELKVRFVKFLDSIKESTLKHNQAADDYDREIAMNMQRFMLTGSEIIEPESQPNRPSSTSTASFTPAMNPVPHIYPCFDPNKCSETEETLSDLLSELCKAKMEKADLQSDLSSILNLLENLASRDSSPLKQTKIEKAWESMSEWTRERLSPLLNMPKAK